MAKPRTADNAINSLYRLSGDMSEKVFIERTLRYLENEKRRLEEENTRLRYERDLPRTGDHRLLTVKAGDGSYTRDQPLVIMRWTCAICGASHERQQLPGNTPKYCPAPAGQKQSECQKEASRRRVKAHRAAKRQQSAGSSETDYAKRVSDEQADDDQRDQIGDKRHAPPDGYLFTHDWCDKYELSVRERRGLKHAVLSDLRKTHNFKGFDNRGLSTHIYADRAPTNEELNVIRAAATITKRQACEAFNVSPYKFDRAKKLHPISHISTFRAGSQVGYVYSLLDVERMLAAAGYIEDRAG